MVTQFLFASAREKLAAQQNCKTVGQVVSAAGRSGEALIARPCSSLTSSEFRASAASPQLSSAWTAKSTCQLFEWRPFAIFYFRLKLAAARSLAVSSGQLPVASGLGPAAPVGCLARSGKARRADKVGAKRRPAALVRSPSRLCESPSKRAAVCPRESEPTRLVTPATSEDDDDHHHHHSPDC